MILLVQIQSRIAHHREVDDDDADQVESNHLSRSHWLLSLSDHYLSNPDLNYSISSSYFNTTWAITNAVTCNITITILISNQQQNADQVESNHLSVTLAPPTPVVL